MEDGKRINVTFYALRITHYALRITLYALTLFIVSGCAASSTDHDPWIGEDKFYHFVAGAAIGAGSSVIARNNGASESEASIVGVSVAIGAGSAKEFYDKYVKHTFWSWKDLFWDLVGGTIGGFAGSKIQ